MYESDSQKQEVQESSQHEKDSQHNTVSTPSTKSNSLNHNLSNISIGKSPLQMMLKSQPVYQLDSDDEEDGYESGSSDSGSESDDSVLEAVGSSKGRLPHRRSATAYGVMSGTRNQGPHTTAHVSTAVALEAARRRGTRPSEAVGSRLIPPPSHAARRLRKTAAYRGGGAASSSTAAAGGAGAGTGASASVVRRRARRHRARYRRLYEKAAAGDDRAAERAMELAPMQTYVHSGRRATREELAGKGERRAGAARDLRRLSRMRKRARELPAGVTTVDTTSVAPAVAGDVRKRARALGRFAAGKSLSDDSGSSDEESSDGDDS